MRQVVEMDRTRMTDREQRAAAREERRERRGQATVVAVITMPRPRRF